MELVKIGIERFKDVIYPEYQRLFPALERKEYDDIEKSVKNSITDIIEIVVDNKFVGFIMVNTLKDNPYAQLDYLAIIPDYQQKGYGKQALKLLKDEYRDYKGIFVEIEKIGLGENDKENEIRKRRIKFYESVGCIKLGFDLNLYKVIYSSYMLPCLEQKFSNEEVIKRVFQIYNAVLGENRVNKNCKVV